MHAVPLPAHSHRTRRLTRGIRPSNIISKKKKKKKREEKKEIEDTEISNLFSPKANMGDDDIDDILGKQKIGTFKDMIEGGSENGFLEIGEIIDENSIQKKNVNIKVKSNKGDQLDFKLLDFEGKNIKQMKKNLFKDHLKGGSKVRLLMNGRLLQDKDKVDEIKFDANTIITAFVSPRLKNLDTSKSSNEGSSDDNGDNDDTQIADANSSMVLDAMNGQRGFDYFKANGYTDEEIIWKRYTYHGHFILTESLEQINDEQLFIKEECFLFEHTRFVSKPELFKFCEFLPEKKEVVKFSEKMKRVSLVLLGLFLGIFFICFAFHFKLKEEYRNRIIFGFALQALLLITFFDLPFQA